MQPAQHEKLFVYRRALDAASAHEALARGLPHSHRDLQDQLRRASASVVRNIAEGANEFSPAEKARFYRMARRSAAECMGIFDFVERVLDKPPRIDVARALTDETVALLTRLIRSLRRRA